MGFARTVLAHGNIWFGKKKEEKARDEEPLIPGYMVTCVMEQQLCFDQLLKVKLPRVFRGGSNSWEVDSLDMCRNAN